jgi:hypothetical protein
MKALSRDEDRQRLLKYADDLDAEAGALEAEMKAQPEGSARTEMQMQQQQSKEEPKKKE